MEPDTHKSPGPRNAVPAPERRTRAGRLIRLILGWILTVLGILTAVPLVPGPGILLFLSGVTLLSTESRWIRRMLRKVRERRLVRRAMREAERVGFKIDPGDRDEDDDPVAPAR